MGSVAAKRAIDLVITVPVFALSLPAQGVAAAAIAVSMGRPVIFAQERPGLGARPFTLRKFRTMHPVDPARGWTDDESRLTPVGKFLRATSIDELPTLWNVIRGEMSLVGPRPLLMRYIERYSPEQARRMEVKPGLTGLAQVSGRNSVSWVERLALDVEYVDRQSVALDMWILARTVMLVLRREGVSAEGHATMPEFMGESEARTA